MAARSSNIPTHPPSGPIQTQPKGLLGFLQLKNSGRNPSDLSDLLQPVMEMREWMWETNAEVVLNVTPIPAATVAGNYILFSVPANEVWALLDFDFIYASGAAQTATYRLMFMDAPPPQGAVFGLVDYVTRAANNTQGNSTRRNDRIVVLGGQYQIGLHFSAINTNALDVPQSSAIRIVRCRA